MFKPRLLLSVAVCGVLALSTTVPLAEAARRNGVITGKLKVRGLGKSARLDFRAISTRTGVIADTISVPVGADYDLAVPPGPYMVAAAGFDIKRGTQGKALSRIVRVRRRVIRQTNLRLRASRSRMVAGVESIRVPGVPGYPNGLEIGDLLTHHLSAGCGPGGPELLLVELMRRKDMVAELRLTGREPSFIPHRYVVRGSGRMSGGGVSLELRLVDRRSGRTVTEASVSGPDERFVDLAGDLDLLFRDAVCKGRRQAKPQPPERYRMFGYRAEYTGSGSSVASWDCPPSVTVAQDKGERGANYSWSFPSSGQISDTIAGTVTENPFERSVFQYQAQPPTVRNNEGPPSTRTENFNLRPKVIFPDSGLGSESGVLQWRSSGPVGIEHELRVPGEVGDRFVLDLTGSRTEPINCGTTVQEEHGTVVFDPVVFDGRYEPPENLYVPYQ